MGLERFGASALGEIVIGEYGFSCEHVTQQVLTLIKERKKPQWFWKDGKYANWIRNL